MAEVKAAATKSRRPSSGQRAETAASEVQEERKECNEKIARKERPCDMCSDSVTKKYHRHYSTASFRRSFWRFQKGEGTYVCPICKDLESVTVPANETRRVVVADSTMYGIWGEGEASTEHFDIDTIVDGTVQEMMRALVRNYLEDQPNRVEILVIAGISNIAAGENVEDIINDMKVLKRVVDDHSKQLGHSPPSYVSFCTVLLPPKFCSLNVPPSKPNEPDIAEWVPPPNFRNKYDELDKLNNMILKMNGDLRCVRMDWQGVKRFNSGNKQHKFDTKPGATKIWKETKVFRKLHFTMEMKLKLVGYIMECFKNNHRIISDNNSLGHDQ